MLHIYINEPKLDLYNESSYSKRCNTYKLLNIYINVPKLACTMSVYAPFTKATFLSSSVFLSSATSCCWIGEHPWWDAGIASEVSNVIISVLHAFIFLLNSSKNQGVWNYGVVIWQLDFFQTLTTYPTWCYLIKYQLFFLL